MLKFPYLILAFLFFTSCKKEHNQSSESTILTKEIIFDGAKTKGRVWVQKEFVLSTFDGVPSKKENFAEAISNLKEAGFNYVETAWRSTQDTKDILEECDNQGGIKVIAQDLTTLGGFAWFTIIPYHEDSITKVLNNFGHYKSLGGIYVYDEPKQEEFHIVKNNTNSLEQRRPDLLGFTVLLQSYSPWYKWDMPGYVNFDKYVDRYMTEVAPAVLSTDYYPMYEYTTNESFTKDNFWRDLSYMRKKSLEKKVIFWFYYQSAAHDSGLTQKYITAGHVRVQAWAAILYGAKGLQSFCARNVVVDSLGKKGSLFNDVKQLNKEIKAVGNTLLALKSKAVYHGDPLVNDPLEDKIESSKYISRLPEFISTGEFCDDHGNDYILVLNRNFQSSFTGALSFKDVFRLYPCGESLEDQYIERSELQLKLHPGQAKLFRIENTSNHPTIITYTIK